jgi:serine/threonine protein phosphatase 1
MKRLIALGDIHGCIHALDTVLEAIQPTVEDRIVILGDFIDTGRDTKSVIERLLQLQDEFNVIVIRGNHEEMLLAALEQPELRYHWEELGGLATLHSYEFMADLEVIPAAHIDFIRNPRNYYETRSYIFTHASYVPELPMRDQPEHTLRWEMLEPPYPEPHISGKTVVVGHTEQRDGEVLDLGHLVCLDTYCREYGWLTAMDLLSGTTWQANRWGALREACESIEEQQLATSILKDSLIGV